MLTLVVRDRQPLLCTIEEDEKGLCAVSTEIGRAVLEETEHITKIYPQIRILCRQIMPDHLHLLLFVEEALPVHLTSVVSGFKLGCNRGYWNSLAKLANTEHRREEKEDRERINGEKIPLAKLADTEHRGEEADTERRCGEENDKKQTAVSCAADLWEAEKKDTQARRTGL